MAKKRTYKGIVLEPGFNTTKKNYKPGDVYKTSNEDSFNYLIKIQKIRK